MDVIRKSILFEIVNKGTMSEPIEAFTLIIPPENIEIEEPQRISKTKTFGGFFTDDYGPDEIKITMTGNTGNTELKKTFIPSDAQRRLPEKMDGKESFYYFRNRLMRYKNNIVNHDKYEMIIYDLSIIPESVVKQDFEKLAPVFAEGYVVVLDKFKMTRNKDKPLFFNYSIELTVSRELGEATPISYAPISVPSPFDLILSIRKSLNIIKSKMGKIKAVLNEIESYVRLVDQVETQLVAFYDQTIDIIIYPTSICKLALSSAKNVLDSIQNVGETVAEDFAIIKTEYWSVILLAQEVAQSAAAIITKAKEPDSYNNNYSLRTASDMTTVESTISRYEGLSDLQAEIFSEVLSNDTSIEDIVVVYGYEVVTITQETSLENLALEYYGDASMQEIIASYNDLEDVDDLLIGDLIKIPTTSQFVNVPGNYIYSSFREDIYGIDIKLDNNYHPVVGESGDYLAISGIDNLLQALNLKLNEALGTRLRLTVYGIKGVVGGASTFTSPIAYILANIKDTTLQDPRIESIENMMIKGVQDRLYISFNSYTIKRGEIVPFNNTI